MVTQLRGAFRLKQIRKRFSRQKVKITLHSLKVYIRRRAYLSKLRKRKIESRPWKVWRLIASNKWAIEKFRRSFKKHIDQTHKPVFKWIKRRKVWLPPAKMPNFPKLVPVIVRKKISSKFVIDRKIEISKVKLKKFLRLVPWELMSRRPSRKLLKKRRKIVKRLLASRRFPKIKRLLKKRRSRFEKSRLKYIDALVRLSKLKNQNKRKFRGKGKFKNNKKHFHKNKKLSPKEFKERKKVHAKYSKKYRRAIKWHSNIYKRYFKQSLVTLKYFKSRVNSSQKNILKRKILLNLFLKPKSIRNKFMMYRTLKSYGSVFSSVVSHRLKKSYRASYYRNTFNFIKMKIHYRKYHRMIKRGIYKKWFRSSLKYFIVREVKLISRNNLKVLGRFYSKYGMVKAMSTIVKFSRLMSKLRRKKQKFIDKKKKVKIKFVRRELTKDEKLLYYVYLANVINRSGKSTKARNFVFKALTLLKFSYKSDFLESYILSLKKVRPLLSYKLIYTGGKKYKIPTLMQVEKSYRIAGRWFANNCSSNDVGPSLAIFNNVKSTLNGTGPIIKQRDDYHNSSFENKSYIYLLRHLKKGFI